MKESTPMSNHLNEFHTIVSQLQSQGVEFDDSVRAMFLLITLPDSWDTFRTIVSNSTTPDGLKYADVESSLLMEEVNRKNVEDTKSSNAMHVRSRSHSRENYERCNKSKSRSRSKSRPDKDNIPGELPPKRGDDVYMIELLPSSSPPNKPPYQVSQAQQEEFMRQVNELVEKGMASSNHEAGLLETIEHLQKEKQVYQEHIKEYNDKELHKDESPMFGAGSALKKLVHVSIQTLQGDEEVQNSNAEALAMETECWQDIAVGANIEGQKVIEEYKDEAVLPEVHEFFVADTVKEGPKV
ncbi:hypothetical protein L7F22_029747 [Adiantum nelumboides]|nr:hypothetical protein [Adiantum nelumboides]